jgi:hypothetical protein
MTAILKRVRKFWLRLMGSRADIEDRYPDRRP